MTGSRRIRRRYRLTTVTSTVGLTDAPAPWPQPTVAPTTVESDRSFNNSSPYASCDDSPGHHRTQNDCGGHLEDHHAGEPDPQHNRQKSPKLPRPGWSGAAAGTHQVWEAGLAVPLGRDGPLIQDAPTDARSYIRHADARKDEM